MRRRTTVVAAVPFFETDDGSIVFQDQFAGSLNRAHSDLLFRTEQIERRQSRNHALVNSALQIHRRPIQSQRVEECHEQISFKIGQFGIENRLLESLYAVLTNHTVTPR